MRHFSAILAVTISLAMSMAAGATVNPDAIDKRQLESIKPVTERPLPTFRVLNSQIVKTQLSALNLMANMPAPGEMGLNDAQVIAVRQNLERNGIRRVD